MGEKLETINVNPSLLNNQKISVKFDDNEIQNTTNSQEPLQHYHADYIKIRDQNLARLVQKRKEEEKYNTAITDARYKRLMHLLKQSQFYVNCLLNPESKKSESEQLKEKSTSTLKYKTNIKIKVNKNKRKKLKGSEIEEILSQSSDEENMDPKDNYINKLKNDFTESVYFKGELYDFQKTGVQWLLRLRENSLNGILADEMGLGKTIQVIALFAQLLENKVSGQHIVIAPLSTLSNWMNEFERFTPDLQVVLYHGANRISLWKQIRKTYTLPNGLKTKPIIITNYESLVIDISKFSQLTYNYIVVDEGQRIKNYKTELSRIFRELRSLNKLILTGTPLQNNLLELWSLLNFILPEVFHDLDLFVSWFDVRELQSTEGQEHVLKLEEEKNVIKSLREILNPFMLRRLKNEVGLKIPSKKEVIVYCPMTELQHNLYQAVLNRDICALSMMDTKPAIENNNGRPIRKCRMAPKYSMESKSLNELKLSLTESKTQKWKLYTDVNERNINYLLHLTPNNRMTNYKKIVNHPYLIQYPLKNGLLEINENIIKQSGKLMVLDRMLEKLYATGHKVLLFSTWVQILDIIEDYLSLRSYTYCRLDGSVKLENRIKDIKTFNNDPNCFLYMLTTRAGGVGLNLMAADTVIIYDCDWNPQMDIQAMARCHRVGQTRPVMIYKFCTKGTIDEEIICRGKAKLNLEKVVMEKEFFSQKTVKLLEHLKNIFETTELNVIRIDEQAITEKELDEILNRDELK